MLENDKVIVRSYKGIEYLQFKKLLEFGINHAYTLKSEKLDFSFESEIEKESYAILAEALKLNPKNILKPHQNHTSNVLCVSKYEKNLIDVDGLITNNSELILSSKNADCIIFLFYDPVKKVIANVHSGWKGTFQKVAEKTVMKMISVYHSKPEDIICCICPSIRVCHFEVKEDVKLLCEEIFAFTNKIDCFIKKVNCNDGNFKYYIDTVEINKILFEEIGLRKENIIDCEICSVCNKQYINSARVEGKNFKRATAIISL